MKDRNKGNYNYLMCAKCGGSCCKMSAGLYHPKDFSEITVAHLVERIRKENIAIDWWEGDVTVNGKTYGGSSGRIHYLRPQHKGEKKVCPSWGGICANFTQEKGCSLQEKDRPFQCRMLIPNIDDKDKGCYYTEEDGGDKPIVVAAWVEYNSILQEVAEIIYEDINNERENEKEGMVLPA